MSKRKPTASSSAERVRERRRQPPAEHQFKPGQSGNPKGRPPKPRAPIGQEIRSSIETVLRQAIVVNGPDGPADMAMFQALLLRICGDGLKDSKLAVRALPALMEIMASGAQAAEDEFEDGEAIIDAYIERRLRRQGGGDRLREADHDEEPDPAPEDEEASR